MGGVSQQLDKMKKASMADVAELAGVSKSTVSAVINNKDIVKDATRRRILDAIDTLNYRPTGFGYRGTNVSTGKNIGFVIKEAGNPYYAETLAGIQEVARKAGYLVFVASSEGEYETEKKIVERFASGDFDGMIITPILNDDTDLSHIFDLKRLNIPFILLENVRGVRAGLVDIDNVQASCLAVKHLLDLEHTQIAHFAGPQYSEHSEERVQGVRRAFSESHLIFNGGSVIQTGDTIEAGYHAALEYFSERGADRATGVTCYNDLVAIGVLKALRELDLRVPEDVSVIGFDDLSVLQYFPLSLTSVHVPKFEMGRKAAELLIAQIEAKGRLPQEKIVLEAELVVRGSTARVGERSMAAVASDSQSK